MGKNQKYTCIDASERLVNSLYRAQSPAIGEQILLHDRRSRGFSLKHFEVVDKRTSDKGEIILTVTESED